MKHFICIVIVNLLLNNKKYIFIVHIKRKYSTINELLKDLILREEHPNTIFSNKCYNRKRIS